MRQREDRLEESADPRLTAWFLPRGASTSRGAPTAPIRKQTSSAHRRRWPAQQGLQATRQRRSKARTRHPRRHKSSPEFHSGPSARVRRLGSEAGDRERFPYGHQLATINSDKPRRCSGPFGIDDTPPSRPLAIPPQPRILGYHRGFSCYQLTSPFSGTFGVRQVLTSVRGPRRDHEGLGGY